MGADLRVIQRLCFSGRPPLTPSGDHPNPNIQPTPSPSRWVPGIHGVAQGVLQAGSVVLRMTPGFPGGDWVHVRGCLHGSQSRLGEQSAMMWLGDTLPRSRGQLHLGPMHEPNRLGSPSPPYSWELVIAKT
jgi:hypothetical protein